MLFRLIYKGGNYTLLDDKNQVTIITSEALNQVISAVNIENTLSVSIDAEEFFIRKALLPKIGLEKVKDILPVEMEGRFIVPSKELFFELILLEEQEDGDTYLVFALRRQLLMDMLMPFLNKGIKIESVSINNLESISGIIEEELLFKAKGLNFFPTELNKYSEKKIAYNVVKKIIIYTSAVFLIIISGLSLRLYFLHKKELEIKKELVAQYNAIFTEAKSANLSANIIQAKLQELKQNYRALRGVELLDILKDLSIAVNNVTVKDINIDKGRLTIKGEGKDYASIEQYKTALRKSISNINISETKNISDGRMTFVMEATIAE